MKVNDITFVEHERGIYGAQLFCDLDKGTIHLNASHQPGALLHLDEVTHRRFNMNRWLERNIEAGLCHETVHLSMVEAGEREASLLLNRLERKHDVSGIDFAILDSEFKLKGEKNGI